MTLTKEQLLEQSKIQDKLFPAPVSYRSGQPCDHPGCVSHLSHPCEGCGRYGAGMRDGPCPFAGTRYIENLAMNDTVIHSFLMLKQKFNWTWEQTLIALVIKQSEIYEKLTNGLIEIQQQSDLILTKVKDRDNEISDRPK